MMNRLHNFTAIALTGLVSLSALSAPIAASASEEGKRNTALGLGAAALGLLLTQHNKLSGLIAAGGAAYAYSQYNNDIGARHRRARYGYYDRPQNNDYRNGQNHYRYNENGPVGYNQDNVYRNSQDQNQTYDHSYSGDNSIQNDRFNRGDTRGADRRTAFRTTRRGR